MIYSIPDIFIGETITPSNKGIKGRQSYIRNTEFKKSYIGNEIHRNNSGKRSKHAKLKTVHSFYYFKIIVIPHVHSFTRPEKQTYTKLINK